MSRNMYTMIVVVHISIQFCCVSFLVSYVFCWFRCAFVFLVAFSLDLRFFLLQSNIFRALFDLSQLRHFRFFIEFLQNVLSFNRLTFLRLYSSLLLIYIYIYIYIIVCTLLYSYRSFVGSSSRWFLFGCTHFFFLVSLLLRIRCCR